jgi:ribosome recycling factor
MIIGIRGNAITAGMVDTVRVNYYGSSTPIKHLAVTGKVGQTITIEPYDLSLIGQIVTALKSAGFNAYPFSKTRICVNIPIASGEQRDRNILLLRKLGEETKIAIRNLRKKYRKENPDIDIQPIIDKYIKEVDSLIDNKINNL